MNTYQLTSTGLHSAVPVSTKALSSVGSRIPTTSRKSIAFASQKDVLEVPDTNSQRKKKSKGVKSGAGDKITQAVEGLTRARKYLERERTLLSSKTLVPNYSKVHTIHEHSSSDESDEGRTEHETKVSTAIRSDYAYDEGEMFPNHASLGFPAHISEGVSELQKALQDAQERWDSRFHALEGSILRLQDRFVASEEQPRRRDQARPAPPPRSRATSRRLTPFAGPLNTRSAV